MTDNSRINVLVTGIGGGGNGEQILKALRLIDSINLHIIGTDVTEFTTGKILVDEFHTLPAASAPKYLDKLTKILDENNIHFLFTGSEPELKLISKNRDILKSRNIAHPFNSNEIIELCMNKHETYKKLESLGFDLPAYKKINSVADAESIDFFPAILKPNTGSGGSNGVSLVTDTEEASLLTKLMLKDGVDIIAQAYIGDHNCEYTIGVSSSPEGKVMGSISVKRYITNALTTYKKVRRADALYTISSGISQGMVCHQLELQQQAEKIAQELGSVGPLNVQCRNVNGKLMLFEINPRISGTTYVRAMAGYNEPEAMIKKFIMGEDYDYSYEDKLILRTVSEIEIPA